MPPHSASEQQINDQLAEFLDLLYFGSVIFFSAAKIGFILWLFPLLSFEQHSTSKRSRCEYFFSVQLSSQIFIYLCYIHMQYFFTLELLSHSHSSHTLAFRYILYLSICYTCVYVSRMYVCMRMPYVGLFHSQGI